jgi:hypothetical protein
MTLKDLRQTTALPIYIRRTDDDGNVQRTEYTGGRRDWDVVDITIIHVDLIGFALGVELGEEV